MSALAQPASAAAECMRFVTLSDKPVSVDLTIFAEGTASAAAERLRAEHKVLRKGGMGLPPNPFTGRPELILQMAPAFRELYLLQRRGSVRQAIGAFYSWFRLFDEIERKGKAFGKPVPAVRRVEDITEVHRQLALDAGISWQNFGPFKRVLNLTRQGLQLRKLMWPEPERPEPKRILPDIKHITELRHEFKHRWFATLNRWNRCDELLTSTETLSAQDERIRDNALWLQDATSHLGKGWPAFNDLAAMGFHHFYDSGLSVQIMLESRYATRTEVLAAFHLCLASTGWNPQTILDFDVGNPESLRTHPKDPRRYVMRAFKARSKLDQFSEGLWKSDSAPGVVMKRLIERTAPLREQLKAELEAAEKRLKELRSDGVDNEEVSALRLTVARLAEGVRCVWLYPSDNGTIGWLSETTWSKTDGGAYLTQVIADLNARRTADKQIPHFRPSDFRDGFAAYAYLHSGGMVYFVMRVLGHRWVKSTETYIRNTFLNERSIKVYRTFTNGLMEEIRVNKRLDPTILAMITRDGKVTARERKRLAEYRRLRRSRLGVGCSDPFNPPKHIAPGFEANGKRKCPTQRCTLCIENAVIFAESLDGLAMRWAELMWLRSTVPFLVFSETSFQEELDNTEVALLGFEQYKVEELKRVWQARIESGEHFTPQFGLMGDPVNG